MKKILNLKKVDWKRGTFHTLNHAIGRISLDQPKQGLKTKSVKCLPILTTMVQHAQISLYTYIKGRIYEQQIEKARRKSPRRDQTNASTSRKWRNDVIEKPG